MTTKPTCHQGGGLAHLLQIHFVYLGLVVCQNVSGRDRSKGRPHSGHLDSNRPSSEYPQCKQIMSVTIFLRLLISPLSAHLPVFFASCFVEAGYFHLLAAFERGLM